MVLQKNKHGRINGMKKSIFLKISAIIFLMAGVVFCSCSNSNDEPIEPVGPVGPKTYTLSIEASKGGSAETRVLTPGDNSLVSTWETSDKVYVTKSEESSSCGLLQPQSSGATATLSGKITGTFAQGDVLTFQYPQEAIDYTGQKGTLADISANYDYSVAEATVGQVGANAITVTGLSDFENQQAIVKFTLKDAYGYAVNATSLKVSATGLKTSDSATGDIIVNVPNSSATNVFYVALSGVSKTTVSLTATTADNTYIYYNPNVTFTNGKYYDVTVKMQCASEPLTFEAVNQSEATSITFHDTSSNLKMKYQVYNSQEQKWADYNTEGGTFYVTLYAGDKVVFFGKNGSYYPGDGETDATFTFTGDCYVYGNVMSLVSSTGYTSATELTNNYAFGKLFNGNTYVLNHPNKELLLPATTLMPYCYQSMFQGCTGLTRAPVLPAPTLATSCYYQMFKGCTNLNYIKCLATSFASGSTTDWVVGVNGNGTFVKDPNADWSSMSEGSGIPLYFTSE